ncbi:MAG: hypothetical protein JNG89_20200 [Planctomycetaceae bacterium]|nr:hypothetical protein [Planctomycetaceae bacterium]
MTTTLDKLPLSAFFVLTVAIVLAAIEFGFRGGRYRHQRYNDEKEGPVGAMVAATLGLLAFILAFTFGLAASRYDARRTVVVDEANTIGTTYLRAGLLPDERAARIRPLLRDYVDARLEAARTGNLLAVQRRSDELQHALWTEAELVGQQYPESIVAGLFIQALNETIDIHATRLFAVQQGRIPVVLWLALLVVTVLTMAGVGYFCGMSRSRRTPEVLLMALAYSAILLLVADLDRPLEGLVRVSQQAMIDVRAMMDDIP